MIAPVCPACDHIGHPTIVAGSRFLPGPHKYRPADADGPLFATRKEAEEWVRARRRGDATEDQNQAQLSGPERFSCDNGSGPEGALTPTPGLDQHNPLREGASRG